MIQMENIKTDKDYENFSFLNDILKYKKYEAYKWKKFSHYNYLFTTNNINYNLNSQLTSGEGLLNLLAKGSMRYQINWCDLNRNFYVVDMLGKLSKHKKLKILDVGCGKSEIMISLYRHMLRVEYHGIDLNVKDLMNTLQNKKTAETYYLYHLDLTCGLDMFKDEYFDVIFLFDIIEHLPTLGDGELLLKNVLKKLKSTGTIFLTTPNKNNADDNKEFVCGSSHKHEYIREQLLEMFRNNNVKVLKEFGGWMSKKMYNSLSTKDKFIEKIYNGIACSDTAKLQIISNFYPEYSKELFYILEKKNQKGKNGN